jgi:hypothetical protein
MGFDKLINFLYKNFSYDTIEDINTNINVRKIIVNHIFFDISFIIYKNLIELEEEINNIIKIILALPFNFNNTLIQEKILNIINQEHWEWININFDGNNEDEIINNFILFINKYINDIIAIKINNNIYNIIYNTHYIEFIQTINIIFDGIPSYSKILEQRRRRMKTYLESQEKKKKFDLFFPVHNTFQEYDQLSYDYFKWIKLKFSLDKSFGPISPLIINLEEYIKNNLSLKFPNILINIDSGKNNGEADYKIFQNIQNNNIIGDICIHTIDSDLVHQIIVQQNYFNIINKDINLFVIKYNYKNDNHIQFIDARNIINYISKLYLNISNSDSFNYFIIWDIALLLYFFGNDHLPSSFEIGPELSLEYLLKTHYNVFKNKKSIIDLTNNEINFNLTNLSLYLKEIYIKNELNKTKIILGRYFKLSNQLIIFLVDKLELTFDKILLLCRKLLFDNGKNTDNLDSTDIRYKLINKYNTLTFPFDIDNLKNISKNDCYNYFDKLLSQLDISDTEELFCGLPLYIKPFYLCDNNYKNLYTTFTENISNELEKKFPIIYNYTDFTQFIKNFQITTISNDKTKMYIKKLFHLVTSLFANMTNYNSNNFTYYKYYQTPSLYDIIHFIDNNTNIKNNIINEINDEIRNNDTYFNSINHHIIITPYIKNILNKFNSNDLEFLVNSININNFWYDNNENFDYKDFNINDFLNQWFNSVVKLKFDNILTNKLYLI